MGCGVGGGRPDGLDREWGSDRVGFQTRDGIPDRGWDTKNRWGSSHGMMGYQTGDDELPGRGGVTKLEFFTP